MEPRATGHTRSKLSDHCLVDHSVRRPEDPEFPSTPVWTLRRLFMNLDRLMHFTGIRGALWRALGVDRSPKNPNVCNV